MRSRPDYLGVGMADQITIYRSTEEGEAGRWFAVGHDPAAGLHGRDRTYYEPLTRYSRRRFWRAALHPWRYRLRVRLVRSLHGRREWQFTIARRRRLGAGRPALWAARILFVAGLVAAGVYVVAGGLVWASAMGTAGLLVALLLGMIAGGDA